MAGDQRREIKRLMKKFKISFDGRISTESWPSVHKILFKNIQKLGAEQYENYKDIRKARSADEPWGANAIRRANRIVQVARRCYHEDLNEAGWRLALEPEVFSRFKVEVACPMCRARLWRSEIEVEIENDKRGRSLQDRRMRRKPCKCEPNSRQHDFNEPGINELFSDRAEEVFIHDPMVTLQLAKRDRPDRVYGLRETKNFERALSSERRCSGSREEAPVEKAIKCSPFGMSQDPLLFPFLVLEAKSEKGDGFASIEAQTAFSIRTLLKLQEDLENQSDLQSVWNGPMVWFLANRGDSWRVAASFLDRSSEEPTYRIVELWSGRLNCHDGALQLVLILDHVFDWARDVYRPAILHHLKSLSVDDPSDSASVSTDSDIFSMADPVRLWMNRDKSADVSGDVNYDEANESMEVVRPVPSLDSAKGVVRQASFIDSEFLALYITGDNAGTMFHSLSKKEHIKPFARRILRALLNKKSLILTERTLNALEDMWTGGASHLENPISAETEFVVRIILRSSLTDDWEQVRELSYLAVAKADLDVIVKFAELDKMPVSDFKKMRCVQQSVIDRVRRSQSMSPKENIEAAIQRSAFSLELDKEAGNGSMIESLTGSLRWVRETKRDQTNAIIHDIYDKNKRGLRPVTEPFIRESSRLDGPPLSSTPFSISADLIDLCKSSTGAFVVDPYAAREVRKDYEFVVVVRECVQPVVSKEPSADVCLFLTSALPVMPRAADVMKALHMILETQSAICSTLRYRKHLVKRELNLNHTRGSDLEALGRKKIHDWIVHLYEESNFNAPAIAERRAGSYPASWKPVESYQTRTYFLQDPDGVYF